MRGVLKLFTAGASVVSGGIDRRGSEVAVKALRGTKIEEMVD
jgi:hypothetical protein